MEAVGLRRERDRWSEDMALSGSPELKGLLNC